MSISLGFWHSIALTGSLPQSLRFNRPDATVRSQWNRTLCATPRGLEQKSRLTLQFLHRKVQEYEVLRAEIRELRQEVEGRG